MYQLKQMKEKLINAIEAQINGNLEYANTEELGEAVDMVKDLSEAIYYCTITEAMNDQDQAKGGHYPVAHYYGDGYVKEYPTHMDYNRGHEYPPMLYASDGQSGGRGGNQGGSRNYTPMMYYEDGNRQMPGESRNYTPMMYNSGSMYPSPEYGYPMMSPEHEGRSPMVRRRYMDGKKMNDKTTQMKELEQYTQELASDLTDMIKDASPEEKQLLQQKISLLASKIK